jgi:hypothetical protein
LLPGFSTTMSAIDLSFFDRNHYIIFPKPPLRPAPSQDVKHGIVLTGLETSLWGDFMESIEEEFDSDYDPSEEKLCVYFHNGPRFECNVSPLIIVSTKEYGIAYGP